MISPTIHVRPRVALRVERGRFVIKTVDCREELEDALRLCDHLVIIDSKTGAIAGTYRLTSTTYSENFYASKRFELGGLLALPGVKIELGRACVDSRYRGGATLPLLWRGIVEYAREAGASYLFGSASLRNTVPALLRALCDRLGRDGYFDSIPGVNVKAGCRGPLPAAEGSVPAFPDEVLTRLIPPLFQSYLRAGARLCAEPAFDPYLDSIDFLTLLKLDGMTSRFARRFS
jgi:putative hemolysin